MLDLTFGEQVKIILRRKGMTIKELAERMEEHTGKKMSRQNLTQRLGRDNFQEQDMRQIAEILGCRFQLSIMEESVSADNNFKEEQNIEIENIAVEQVLEEPVDELAISVEEPVYEEPVFEDAAYEEQAENSVEEALKEMESLVQEDKAYKLEKEQKNKKKGWRDRFGFNRKAEPVKSPEVPAQPEEAQEEVVYEEAVQEEVYEEPVYEEPVYEEPVYEEPVYEEPVYEEPVYEEPVYEKPVGDINPYTGREYETNSVRMHPKKIGYVQVYDGEEHKWIDMTEWAFLGYQEQKKMLLGKDYDPPIYLD